MTEVYQEKEITNNEMIRMITDQFAMVFQMIDDTRTEFKKDIADLQSEMNQRFDIVDIRLSSLEKRMANVEGNMVYKQLSL